MGVEFSIPQFRELFDIRKQLLVSPYDIPNYAIGINGISIFKNALSNPIFGDCFNYTFRYSDHPKDEFERVRHSLPILPEPGAFIFYYNNKDTNNWPTHMGRVAEDGYVISKWGRGHVYRHLSFLVPLSYGNEIRYYKGI